MVSFDGSDAPLEPPDPGPIAVPGWLDAGAQITWRALVLVVGGVIAVSVATRLYLVTLPVILALVLATLFVPPARRLERRGFPRLAAAAVVVLGGIGAFGGVIALIAPAFVAQARELVPTVVTAAEQVLSWLEEGPIGYDRAQIDELIEQAFELVQGAAGTIASQVGSIALAVGEAVTALSLAIVLLFFFVKDGAQIVDWMQRLVPARYLDDVRATGTRGWVALSGFVRGTAAVALIDAVGIGIGLAIVGVPLVLPLSVLVFFGGFVPVIGAFVTGILAVLVALATGGFQTALIVAGIVLAVQQIESNVLQPTIMRRAVSLHPVVVLAVLTAGAVLVGIIGAFLAVPIMAVLAAVGNEIRLRRKARAAGHEPGPTPLGGPRVDPELTLPQFPPETELKALRGARQGATSEREARALLRRRKKRATAAARAAIEAADTEEAAAVIEQAIAASHAERDAREAARRAGRGPHDDDPHPDDGTEVEGHDAASSEGADPGEPGPVTDDPDAHGPGRG